jgi:3-oxoacyl-[acyl-carrier-protein] synthase III
MPEAATLGLLADGSAAPGLRGAAVAGVGIAVPPQAVSNASIAARLDVSEDWIVARTGVRERRIASEGEQLADYATEAASRALAVAGVEASEVDLVLVATMTHEFLTPSAAPLVAARIGAASAGAIDIGAACTGFVSALLLGAGQVEAGRADVALVVGADLLSRVTDSDDRSTAALFGDGAGAVVLSARKGGGHVGPGVLGADGARHGLVTAGRAEGVLRIKGHDTFRQAVDRLSEATVAAVAASGRSLDEIAAFVYHQANARILLAVGERLGLDPARVVDCISRYGNTSAATIPLALAQAQDDGLLEPGAPVLLAAFGGGLTWAATVIEWGAGEDGGDGDDR